MRTIPKIGLASNDGGRARFGDGVRSEDERVSVSQRRKRCSASGSFLRRHHSRFPLAQTACTSLSSPNRLVLNPLWV